MSRVSFPTMISVAIVVSLHFPLRKGLTRMIPRWLIRSALMGVIFAVFSYGLDRVIDPTVLRGLEVAALLLLGGTLALTGAAIGAARIDVESRALDWLLYAQLSVLICVTFRLLDGIIDSAPVRALASATLVTMGGCVVSIGGSALARRRSDPDRASP